MANITLSQICNRFADSTSLHGVRRMADKQASFIRRSIWAVCVLISLGVVIWMSVKVFYNLVHPQISSRTLIQKRPNVRFPAISICNYNQFRKSFVEQHLEVRRLLQEYFPSESEIIYESTEQQTEAQPIDLNQVDILELIRNGSYSLEDTVLFTRWGFMGNVSGTFQSIMTPFGLCYTFVTTWLVQTPGSQHGLHMGLDVGVDEYYVSLTKSMAVGFVISIHDYNEIPLPLQIGFNVAPGTETAVALRLKEVERLNNGDCLDTTSSSFINPLRLQKHYTYVGCIAECKAQMMYRTCNCTLFYDSGGLYPVCRWQDELNCVHNDHAAVTYCGEGCKEACHTTTFEVQLSSASYPSPYYSDRMTSSWNRKYATRVTSGIISLNVFFESLMTVVSKDFVTFTLNDFWGTLGGSLGLCLGCSLLSILELVEFVAALLVILWRAGRNGFSNSTKTDVNPTDPNDVKT